MSLSEKELTGLVLINRLCGGGVSACVFEQIDSGLGFWEVSRKILEENLFEKKEELEKLLKIFSPEEEMRKCRQAGIRLLSLWDEDYPSELKNISDPPALLYLAGNIIPHDAFALAIVGSRYPSVYGLTQTRRFSSALASAGLTIVSGLAQGIDCAAHEGVLEVSHGRTLAVLGCGLDVDYPRHRKKIQEKFLERGAVMTEYPLGTPPLPENFPKRNRIIAGLSLGVFVAEAHERSGSLITARQALEQGKDVFALPGPVDRITSRGAHRLIKEGACLVETPQDILENLKTSILNLNPDFAPHEEFSLGEAVEVEAEEVEVKDVEIHLPTVEDGENTAQRIIGLLKSQGPLFIDQITLKLEIEPERLMPFVTLLELRRKIVRTKEGQYAPVDSN